jgi:hypothetical protein
MTDKVVSMRRAEDVVSARLADWYPMKHHSKDMFNRFPWPDDTLIEITFRATVDGDDPRYEAFQALFSTVEQRSND